MYAIKYKNPSQKDARYVLTFSEHMGVENQNIMKFSTAEQAMGVADRMGLVDFEVVEAP